MISKFSSLFIPFYLLCFQATSQSISIKGKIIDHDSGSPLEWATVALLNASDSSLISGGNSSEDGSFDIKVPKGNGPCVLRAGFIGYDDKYLTISLGSKDLNLGTIAMRSGKTLDEIVVEGGSSLFETDIDKRVFNVENNILSQGGTASELLATLPSIQMDEEGGISMRGSGNILIYINGRPSNLSGDDTESILEQFPANSIKSVELITNPSSKYDAAGVGGIINIILKKNEKLGFNGQTNISAGTRNKYTGGINLNYGAGKLNLFSNYNYQYRELYMLGESFRENKIGSGPHFLDQDFDTQTRNQSHLIRTGADYNIHENHNIGFYIQGNLRERERTRTNSQRYLNSTKALDSLDIRNSVSEQANTNFEIGTTYNWDISPDGQKIFTSLSMARDQRQAQEDFDQRYYDNQGQEVPENGLRQLLERPSNSSLFIFQLDYEKPLNKGGKIEGGLKNTFSKNSRSQVFFHRSAMSEEYLINDTISNTFDFNETVHAAYLIYRNELGKLGYQAGVRGELTLTESFQAYTQKTFTNNYFNLFPSLFLSYELKDGQAIQLNYSRRIERPGMWSLTPFYNPQDLLNLRLGNPYLQPEFTDSYEAGYMGEMENYFFTGTVYHRRTSDIITRFIEMRENNAAVQTWVNANSRIATGLELINQLYLTKNIDATLTGNFFHSEIISSNIVEGMNNSNFSWTLNLLGNIKIPNIVSFQLQGNYRGPMVMPQGQIEPMYGFSIGAKKDLWNKKATLSLNVSDILNTQVFTLQTSDPNFYQERAFNRETRIGTLTFTYRFKGYQDVQKKNGKKEAGGGERIDNDMF